jgi:hypothetical protein
VNCFSSVVIDDAHLKAAICYVSLNPVRAGLSDRAEDWPWSCGTETNLPISQRFWGKVPAALFRAAGAKRHAVMLA